MEQQVSSVLWQEVDSFDSPDPSWRTCLYPTPWWIDTIVHLFPNLFKESPKHILASDDLRLLGPSPPPGIQDIVDQSLGAGILQRRRESLALPKLLPQQSRDRCLLHFVPLLLANLEQVIFQNQELKYCLEVYLAPWASGASRISCHASFPEIGLSPYDRHAPPTYLRLPDARRGMHRSY